ncbi:hypothetical protein BC939DRAFT_478164 [Gamsiella multidivaricata]|uniref:uncharacterized protein n=1 Tax=Gamsiella multidivaricata TaxID=101098 RepID=UPI002220B7D5|nr:uncharacterized protein BC939DRAFT_478164 [Gamsiella multidivaricata]KAG0362403.1 hypothetical protein BGZ54_008635 [Gamsiella multidivaricata]KAI7821704.1 hypothetical protein BC939DRAFT_478164 [Gamsiella multidivaricata]
MAAINTNTSSPSEIQEITTPAPAIAFSQEPDRRGRDHSITPLIEEDTVADINVTSAEARKHRSSLAAFADRLRSRSRSHSRQRSTEDDLSLDRTTTQSSVNSTSSRKSSKSRSGSRRSSIDENAPYADVIRAQEEFMEKLRDEQEKNHITHNADGIPIPPRKPSSRSSSRRSSVSHALGLDKPMLAF